MSEQQYDPNNPIQVGGQAVIEGVMMRAKGMIATAVRRSNGEIVIKRQPFTSIIEKYPKLNIPILRGAIGLIEMMYIGISTLNYSAEIAIEDENKKKKEQSKFALAVTLLFSLAVGIGIFFLLPLYTATQFFTIEQKPIAFNLVAGAIRILLLLAYLYAISKMKDVHRLFQYHGAEHKAVFAFEQKAPLEISEAMKYTRFHPRCGTSFVLQVMLIAIILFAVMDTILLQFIDSISLPIRLATHIPFIPVLGGISYEFLKFSAKHSNSTIGKIFVAPGLWLQKITTQEPDESMMDVSLAAIKAALQIDGAKQ
ncbi:MAG: DUF1385 domain-containing protein [Bacteroidetes bacterium]|nr:DUF1385 domain-containing protein [Bacteroidota bacterium]